MSNPILLSKLLNYLENKQKKRLLTPADNQAIMGIIDTTRKNAGWVDQTIEDSVAVALRRQVSFQIEQYCLKAHPEWADEISAIRSGKGRARE